MALGFLDQRHASTAATVMTYRSSRRLQAILIAVLCGLAFIYILESGRAIDTSTASDSADESFAESVEVHLATLQTEHDPELSLDEYGLMLGSTTLQDYTAEVLGYSDEYLTNARTVGYMPVVRSRLSLKPPATLYPELKKQVVTTDRSVADVYEEFDRWRQVMPDWDLKIYDDDALADWIQHWFGGSKAEAIWNELPRMVLKTDLFRYMLMLVEGGVYSDSDTAPLVHADDWGQPYETGTDPKVLELTEHWANSAHPVVDDGNERGEPAVTISIEVDATRENWDDYRDWKMARGIQIVQWTIKARAGHPIFLDVIGRILRKSEEIAEATARAEEAKAEYIPENALEWTGPGVFSDCVFRYLLARYGFLPDDMAGLAEPLRVGDVLILPARSFATHTPLLSDSHGRWGTVWHGFLGRWRKDDPGVKALGWKSEKSDTLDWKDKQ